MHKEDQEKIALLDELLQKFDSIFGNTGTAEINTPTKQAEFEEWRKEGLRTIRSVYRANSTELDCFVELIEDNCSPNEFRQYLVDLKEDDIQE